MGNIESGNCYNTMNERDKEELIQITNYPTEIPLNQSSSANINTPPVISKMNYDFNPNENDETIEKDPLSDKDSLGEIKMEKQKEKLKKDVVYQGNFLNDQFEGEGVFQFKNGDWFKGKWSFFS